MGSPVSLLHSLLWQQGIMEGEGKSLKMTLESPFTTSAISCPIP